MSIGGVLGGIFSSLVALQLFSWIAEYPLMLAAGLLVIPAFRRETSAGQWGIMAGLGLLGVSATVLVEIFTNAHPFSNYGSLFLINAIIALAALYFLFRNKALSLILVFMLFANGAIYYSAYQSSARERGFFGVVRVVEKAEQGVREFQHGTTLHGAMRIADTDPDSGPPLPLTYYTSDGGLSLAIAAAHKNAGGTLQRAGVIGVGAGSLACRFNKGEKLDFFEIDPAVLRIANDPAKFRFLSSCGQDVRMIVGDGRIEIADIADGVYDVLVIDAFSSDSIPVHMMTQEAVSLFMRKVKPGGMLVMHISNSHLELERVVAAIGKSLGLAVRSGRFSPKNDGETLGMAKTSIVAALARSDSDFGSLLEDQRWSPTNPDGVAPWTDGYSNVLAAMWRSYVH